MTDEKQLNDWRKCHRQCAAFLPLNAAALVVVCFLLWLVNLWLPVPTWLAVILIGSLVFVVVGDTITLLNLGRKLRHEERAPPPPP